MSLLFHPKKAPRKILLSKFAGYILKYSNGLFLLVFRNDTKAEIELVIEELKKAGAYDVILSKHWALGGEGAENLAKAVAKAVEEPSNFRFLYSLDLPLKTKIETIAKEMYGAGEVKYNETADRKLKQYEEQVKSV